MSELTRKQVLLGAASIAGAAALPRAALARAAATPSGPLTGERLHRDVRRLCAFGPRRTGTRTDRRTASWVARRLREAGVPRVAVRPYRFRQWKLRGHGVRLVSAQSSAAGPLPRRINAFPIWATAPARGEAEVVYVGLGSQAELDAQDIEGKMILVDGKVMLNVFPTLAILDTYWNAAERGAAGILAPSDAPGDLVRLIAFGDNRRERNPIPAYTVGRESLALLREACLTGATRVSFRLDAEWVRGTTHDVIGVLPGGATPERSLMACSHYDSMFDGALDDATGVVGMIGLAAHFASRPAAERPKTMKFLAVAGHDTGFPFLGVRHWVDEHPRGVSSLDLFCTLDHLASEGYEDLPGGVVETGLDEKRLILVSNQPVLEAMVLEVLAKYRLLTAGPAPIEASPNPDLEGMMADKGVPAINMTMASPYYHTREDTPERIPPEQLERCVNAYREILERTQLLPSEKLAVAAGAGLRAAQL